ncbi:unnamed protein product [Bursaphelenchus xylophilus]|uniref:Delta(3,5)-Delta(2,4)-dienoyl-CoA isomerase, mitochondrial n=1 Tax=Bursaphelenchus xylophilus TaxID=6326 RepID=A0A7I8WQW5_BURXY|nr:unnamed protein product [Bursaphelenchus xylophilus]CAG9097105.1 unnamed protein product [Bursaphelenchus xylophilus]
MCQDFMARLVSMTLDLKFIKLIKSPNNVTQVILNRPKQLNALSNGLWKEIGEVFKYLDQDEDTNVIILSGSGKLFCAGLDIKEKQKENFMDKEGNAADRGRQIYRDLRWLQEGFTAIEKCQKPVIAALHGACIGGGLSIISACDIIYASRETIFSLKEVQLGIAADVGALNRLPFMVGNMSWLKEISLTGRNFDSNEALQFGVISRIFESPKETLQAAFDTANEISQLGRAAVQGTKVVLNYSRDHTVDESLNFVAVYNMSQIQNAELQNYIQAFKKSKI